MKVEVYFNLHKKCLSVRHAGKVILHTPAVELENVEFKVSEAGRQRVLRERRKNVHAVVKGDLVSVIPNCHHLGAKVTYNPYKYDSFVLEDGERPVKKAGRARIFGRKIFAESY